jgi:hypothetical protein
MIYNSWDQRLAYQFTVGVVVIEMFPHIFFPNADDFCFDCVINIQSAFWVPLCPNCRPLVRINLISRKMYKGDVCTLCAENNGSSLLKRQCHLLMISTHLLVLSMKVGTLSIDEFEYHRQYVKND